MFRNKNFKTLSVFLICLAMAALIVSCAPEAPELPDTHIVQKGSITQTVTSSGSIDSSDQKNYTLSVAGDVIKALKKGQYFKKGDILIEVKNDRAKLLVKQAEESLVTAETSIDIAKINYQQARNANHIAIQLSESNTAAAEQATLNAYKAMEDANIMADTSIRSAANAVDSANQYLEVIKLEPLLPDYQVEAAKGSLTGAESQYEQAKESARSQTDGAAGAYEQALDSQSISYWSNLNSVQTAQAQMKLTQKNIEQAENQLALSKVSLELAMLDMDSNKLVAPYDGIVLESNFSDGVYAGPGPAIAIISSVFEVVSDISETDISKIKVGQIADITLDAFPDLHFSGSVSSIAPISKNLAGIITFEVTVEPDDNKNPSFMYGISANLEIETLKVEDVLIVPAEAVYEMEGKKFVDTMDPAADNAIIKIEVTTGASDYDNIEILTGLKEGDLIFASQVQLPEDTGEQGGIRGMFGMGN